MARAGGANRVQLRGMRPARGPSAPQWGWHPVTAQDTALASTAVGGSAFVNATDERPGLCTHFAFSLDTRPQRSFPTATLCLALFGFGSSRLLLFKVACPSVPPQASVCCAFPARQHRLAPCLAPRPAPRPVTVQTAARTPSSGLSPFVDPPQNSVL